MVKGLKKGATGVGKGPLLPVFLQVIQKDIIVLLPVKKYKIKMCDSWNWYSG